MVDIEKYKFAATTKRAILVLALVGCVLFTLGIFMAMNSADGHHDDSHASRLTTPRQLLIAERTADEKLVALATSENHETPIWLKRLYTSIWQNNLFFVGLGLIGLFFIAIQYAAQAGWSAPIKRIPLAMGTWIPISGILMVVVWFIAGHDLFHWTHHSLYVKGSDYDPILMGKQAYFFWPMEAGTFPLFFVLRLVIFFVLWYLFFIYIKKEMLAEDIRGGELHWIRARTLSAIFLIVFAITSSVAAWDWIMSIDAHWFSTMMGWYVFASWWVTGLAVIAFIVVWLKDKGYLKMVNANHLHDLGKFIFAFSIFWAYIWFSQFLLIYYVNLPEEAVYFLTRMHTSPYNWIFYVNIILGFGLPFLLLMTRDAKRHVAMIKVVCPIVVIAHWLDFYNMVTPGIMQEKGGVGFLEIGLALLYLSAFLFVTLNALSKHPLVAQKHPMMQESLHHHI